MSQQRFSDPWNDLRDDPVLKQVVDMLTHLILTHELTPSEIRKAAMMAVIRAESIRPPRVYVRTNFGSSVESLMTEQKP